MPDNWNAFQDLIAPSLFAYAVLLVGLFLFHLACAPYRLEREAHGKAREALMAREKEVARLSAVRPRVIDAPLALAVRNIIAARASQLGIDKIHAEHTGSDEAADLATRLSEIVQMAGLESQPHSELWGGYDPRDRGVFVRYQGSNDFTGFAADIAQALNGGGIAAQAKPREGNGEPFLSFYVARNPQA